MKNTFDDHAEASRISVTGEIARSLVENDTNSVLEVSVATKIATSVVRRYWTDACAAAHIISLQHNPAISNPPRTITISGVCIKYNPHDFHNEFAGGRYSVDGLPEVYIYAHKDDKGPIDTSTGNGCTYEIIGYGINWGCCGTVEPELFDKWSILCSFVVNQVRDLEARLTSKRQWGAAAEAVKEITKTKEITKATKAKAKSKA